MAVHVPRGIPRDALYLVFSCTTEGGSRLLVQGKLWRVKGSTRPIKFIPSQDEEIGEVSPFEVYASINKVVETQ